MIPSLPAAPPLPEAEDVHIPWHHCATADSSEGMADGMRTVHDSMGEMEVPADAYYGASTARARINFPISQRRFGRGFLRALCLVKAVAARTNVRLGLLAHDLGAAIEAAALEAAEGRFDDDFVVDVFQTGSGTSTNMNANEVIAARAGERLGGARGDGQVHPNDHVNLGQSSNDVFPTAIHIAAMEELEGNLFPAMELLQRALHAKAEELADVVKAGRTHLQDAVPITLGQEFSGYADVIRHGIQRLGAARHHLAELPIGGTALGTGLNAHPEYRQRMIEELSHITGRRFVPAPNCFEAMQNRDAAVELSGVLKTIAVGLLKMGNDLRLLASGPNTGLAEIELPAIQPGSSIMPGKINPVIPEAVNMVAAQVIGNDATITVAALNGNLDLNVMMPVIAHNLLESLHITGNACHVLATSCIAGISANRERCRDYAERSASLVTALAPAIGYDAAARVYKRALAEGRSLREIVVAEGLLSDADVGHILDLVKLTKGG